MGFDASEVMRELDGQRVMREVDAQRVLRDASPVASVNNVLRQYQRHARDLIGVDQLQRTIQGSMVHAIDYARIAEMSSTIAYPSLTRVRDTLRASYVLDESVRRILPGLRRNLADLRATTHLRNPTC